MESSDIVAELWRRIQARDWDGVGELLAEDFVLDWPNARIRLRGRTNVVEFNRSYPEGWSSRCSGSLPRETRPFRRCGCRTPR